MSKLAFYRKYRSQTFDEVGGQEHIIQTLSNAIEHKRLAHAYIFSGPRGTGKTTMARILAKAVNVFESEGQFSRLDSELCTRISNFTCADVVEIDAASNTGVDNIRDLNDRVNFTPIECSHKFYIIDEAHMLSTGAFNALLKTLEEPPSHTIFILATTEAHKIPVTIHSRCQHLRFRNLSDAEIMGHLRFVCDTESISISESALSMIARNSSGCMRDALSLLDQLYSFMGNSIKDDDIIASLGCCDVQQLSSYLTAVLSGDTSAFFALHRDLMTGGINPLQLLKELLSFVDAVLAYFASCEDLIPYPMDFVTSVAKAGSMQRATDLLTVLAKVESELRWFSNPALLLQLRLLQFMQASATSASPATQATQANTIDLVTGQSPRPATPLAAKVHTPSPSQVDTPAPVAQSEPAPAPTLRPSYVDKQPSATRVAAAPVQPSPAPVRPSPAPAKSAVTNEAVSISGIQGQWSTFLTVLKEKNSGLYTILASATPVSLDGSCLKLQLKQYVQFFVEKLKESSYQQAFEALLSDFFKQTLSFEILSPDDMPSYSVPAGSSATAQDAAPANASAELSSNPVEQAPVQSAKDETINEIVSIFEGAIVGQNVS